MTGWVPQLTVQADGSITSPVELPLRLEAGDCLDLISAKPLISSCAGTDTSQSSAVSSLSNNLLEQVGPALFNSQNSLAAHADIIVVRNPPTATSSSTGTGKTDGPVYFPLSFELDICEQTSWTTVPNVLSLTQVKAAVKVFREGPEDSFSGFVDVTGSLAINSASWQASSISIWGKLWWEPSKLSVAV